MLVKYDTSGLTGTKSSSSNGLVIFALAVGATWAAYEFWWKPKKEKEKAAAKK